MFIEIGKGRLINLDWVQAITKDPEDPTYYNIRFFNDSPDEYGYYPTTPIKKEVLQVILEKYTLTKS